MVVSVLESGQPYSESKAVILQCVGVPEHCKLGIAPYRKDGSVVSLIEHSTLVSALTVLSALHDLDAGQVG